MGGSCYQGPHDAGIPSRTLEPRLARSVALAALIALVAGLPGVFAVPPLTATNRASPRRPPRCSRPTTSSRSTTRTSRASRSRWHPLAAGRPAWRPCRTPPPETSGPTAFPRCWAPCWRQRPAPGARRPSLDPEPGLLAGATLGAEFPAFDRGLHRQDRRGAVPGRPRWPSPRWGESIGQHNGAAGRLATRLLFWLGLGVATLVKGPVGPLVALMALTASRSGPWTARSTGLKSPQLALGPAPVRRPHRALGLGGDRGHRRRVLERGPGGATWRPSWPAARRAMAPCPAITRSPPRCCSSRPPCCCRRR
jgi:hypothetical protein